MFGSLRLPLLAASFFWMALDSVWLNRMKQQVPGTFTLDFLGTF
jgi:hypothetical protein